jgi:hypothetical protein
MVKKQLFFLTCIHHSPSFIELKKEGDGKIPFDSRCILQEKKMFTRKVFFKKNLKLKYGNF